MQTILFFIFHITFLIIIIYSLNQKFQIEPLGKIFVHGFLLKLFIGIAFVYLFQYKYGSLADSQSIFETSCSLANKMRDNPLVFFKFWFIDTKISPEYKLIMYDWTSQTVFMYKITSLFCFISANNFWIVNLYLSFLSYLGLWLCANSLTKHIKNSELAAIIAFLFFPSTVIWSSGILKESFLWFFCGTMISIILSKNPINIIQKIIFIILSLALFKLKYYYFAVLMAVISIYLIGKVILQSPYFQQHSKKTLAFLGLICALFLVIISNFHDNLRLNYFFEGLVINYYYLVNNSDIDNLVYYSFTNDYFFSTLMNIPVALKSAWFMPMFGETESNILKLGAAAENMLIFCLLLLVIAKFLIKFIQKIKLKEGISILNFNNFKITNQKLLLFCGILYLLVLSVFIALATPNLGTLVRYKVGFLPFAVYILLATLKINSLNFLSFLYRRTNKL